MLLGFLFVFVVHARGLLPSRGSLLTGTFFGTDPADPCDACTKGFCATCNNRCFDSKSGDCASCWTSGCLNETKGPEGDCRSCFSYEPCALCRTGSCARCERCQGSRDGECAGCYAADSQNFTCILDYQGVDCKGCWNANKAPPVILMSGLTASTLLATWVNVPLCRDSITPRQIWPWTTDLTAGDLLCFLQLLPVHYDPRTNTFSNVPGVNVTVQNFGGVDGLSYGYMTQGSMEQFGYRVGVNLFGAPFDWRQSSQGSGVLYRDLKALVEKVFQSTGQKVFLVAPSYGPQITLGFLQQMPQQWKDQYIAWFIADSPVWSGTGVPLYTFASGFPLLPGVPGADRLVRNLVVALPSMLWLAPVAGADAYSFNDTDFLVTTPSVSYPASKAPALLEAVGYASKAAEFAYLHSSGALYEFEAPLVNTYVNYGYGLDTPYHFAFKSDFSSFTMPEQPAITNTSGDDIVPLRSSLRSYLWEDAHKKAGKQLIHAGFAGMPHAYCIVRAFGAIDCFDGIMALLINGTLPKSVPPPPME